jgi:hypothetical protein
MVLDEQIDHGDGTETRRYRTANPFALTGGLFARVTVELIGP